MGAALSAPRAEASTVSAFRILLVCVGNVCRSPLGERLLRSRLPASGFEVSSGGVGAVVGSAMAPEAAAQLRAHGGSPDDFAARQLTPPMVAAADLVLTATRVIRSRVLEDSPGALRRTFTVLELAALLDVVAQGDDPAQVVRLAARERSRAQLDTYDIADPHGRGDEAHAVAARSMAAAVDRIAERLNR